MREAQMERGRETRYTAREWKVRLRLSLSLFSHSDFHRCWLSLFLFLALLLSTQNGGDPNLGSEGGPYLAHDAAVGGIVLNGDDGQVLREEGVSRRLYNGTPLLISVLTI